MIEDSQKKATRANILISDNVLIAITTKLLMEANTFPGEEKLWGKRQLTKKSWVGWKAYYLKAHEGRELHIRACGGKEPFNGDNAATEVPSNSNRNTASSKATIDRLDDYLDNIAGAHHYTLPSHFASSNGGPYRFTPIHVLPTEQPRMQPIAH